MAEHQGKIIKEAINKVGIPIAVLARKLGMSRSSLYNRLTEAVIDDSFIHKVGFIIRYDFSSVFSHLQDPTEEVEDTKDFPLHYNPKYLIELKQLKKNYIQLLQTHRKALILLLKVASESNSAPLKTKINLLSKEMLEIKDAEITEF